MLKRTYPSDVININDYSGYELDIADEQGTKVLQIILSDKGRDNQLLRFSPSKINDYVKEFGLPVFKRHGQAGRQAFELIRNGAIVNVMRVTAKNATYANTVLVAKMKVLKDVPKNDALGNPLYLTPTGEEVTTSLGNTPIVRDVVSIKLETSQINDLRDLDNIENDVIGNLYSDTADGSGYKSYPLFAIACSGRGDFGNSLHFRMTPNLMGDKEREHRTYIFQAYVNEGDLQPLESSQAVSLYNEAMHRGMIEYIETVVQEETNSYKVYMIEDIYDEFVAEIVKVIPDMTEAELEPLFAKTRKGNPHYQIAIEDGSVDLSSLEGIKLNGGSEGDFALGTINREDKINERIKEAYDGLIDDAVNNTISYPLDIMLDANLEDSCKKALISLALRRNDCIAMVDTGLKGSGKSVAAWRETEYNYDNFRIRFDCESGFVYDDLTKKNILVTETYKLAQKIPQHDLTLGEHIPLAGLNYGKASKYVEGTQKPIINDNDMQDLLNDIRVNFSDKYKDIRFYNVELTSQHKYSDLSFYHNVRVLFNIKKDIEEFARFKRYEFTDGGNIAKFIDEVNERIVPKYTDTGKVQSFTVNASQTTREARQKILRWSLDIRFRDFVLYNIIDLNIR